MEVKEEDSENEADEDYISKRRLRETLNASSNSNKPLRERS